MDFAMWAYPWDIRDEGIPATVERLTDAGINEINLATNYHAVHSFSPTNPGQRSYFAQASSYFQPSAEVYGDLTPVPAEQMGDNDWVAEITHSLDDSPISVNAWAVGCHNSRLGLSHPDLTITSPHGDSLPFGLCPSQPAVRAYLMGLVLDLSSRWEFNRIELESFDYFFGSGLSWHHDKVFVDLGKLGAFLLGLCFCDECRAAAADDGIDVDAVQQTCVETIDAISAGKLPSSLDPLQWIRSHPRVAEYVSTRERILEDLYADLRDTVETELGYTIGMLDIGDEWLFGADLTSLGSHVDYYTALAYESSGTAAAASIRAADAVTQDVPIHAGIQPGPPVVDDGKTVSEIVADLVKTGTDRISFYNFGPLPDRSFDWIKDATAPYR